MHCIFSFSSDNVIKSDITNLRVYWICMYHNTWWRVLRCFIQTNFPRSTKYSPFFRVVDAICSASVYVVKADLYNTTGKVYCKKCKPHNLIRKFKFVILYLVFYNNTLIIYLNNIFGSACCGYKGRITNSQIPEYTTCTLPLYLTILLLYIRT